MKVATVYEPWGQEGPWRGLRGSGPWTPDSWPRSSAVADSCRDSCEHWPELCKPTLITSFLPVPDKGSNTPDNLAGETEAHPESLVISLSHHEGRRADRLPRRKFPRSERGKRRGKSRSSLNYILSRGIRVAVTFHRFLISRNSPLGHLVSPIFWIASRQATIFYREKPRRFYVSIFRSEFHFFLRRTFVQWRSRSFDQQRAAQRNTSIELPWSLKIIPRYAVETSVSKCREKKPCNFRESKHTPRCALSFFLFRRASFPRGVTIDSLSICRPSW